jgi:DNA-directed RNA polymerase subunit omega
MMLYPSIVDLLEKAGSKYSLVIAASKRAREICEEGEEEGEPLDGARGISQAAEEIADGTLSIINYEGTDGIIEKVLHNTEELYAEAGEETVSEPNEAEND